jgi:Ferritin-like domain
MDTPAADQSATLPSRRPPITSRRAFLGGAGAVALGAGMLGGVSEAFGKGDLTAGDAAILRFLSAAEILETDLWQQYNELCGIQDTAVPGGSGNPTFTKIMATFDDDMAQYVHDNTHDEMTHFTFLNGYLKSRGAEPVNLDGFRKLPGSTASGAQKIGRLTNLMALTMDTSWYTRYRASRKNPDLGATFPPAIPGLLKGAFPAIPRSDADLKPAKHLQAIANTAAFHFATIEQGGTSLYPSLAQRVKDPEVLQVVLSIGPTETMHFQTWSDIAGDSPPVKDPTNGLVFPDLNKRPFGGPNYQTNLIMPHPTTFLRSDLPVCSIIRPTNTKGAAMGAATFLTAMGLFKGQPPAFFTALKTLARQADAATR